MRKSVFVSALLLTGCASQIANDQTVTLQPDQGIAAVVMDAPDRIREISFDAKDPGGHSFEVPDTTGGPTLYLTPVKAGRYCLKHMLYQRVMYRSHEDLACFTVVAGHITYGGEITPALSGQAGGGPGLIARNYDGKQFHELLHRDFATLAAAYPIATPPPAPLGVETPDLDYGMSIYAVDEPDHSNSLYVQNNASWDMTLKDIYLEVCFNVKQPCGHIPQDLHFAPFETKKVTVLSPTDPEQAFQYHYQVDDFY